MTLGQFEPRRVETGKNAFDTGLRIVKNDLATESILVVDDDAGNLHFLNRVLSDRGYKVQLFPDGQMALAAARQSNPDLILLDIEMPGLNGFEVCENIKKDPILRDTPILFISGLDDVIGKVRAFECGAVDFISKPFNMDEVEARIETRLENRRLHAQLKRNNDELAVLVRQQVQEISDAQLATIQALAKLTESRDDETGHHVERVQIYSKILADNLCQTNSAPGILTCEFATQIYHAAALHDIGKVGIPDSILRKPGKLTDEEFSIMKRHTVIGGETMASVRKNHPRSVLLHVAEEIAMAHHEKFDGSGYPQGLRGAMIPWSARIVALADAYDAIRSRRPYKEPISHDSAADIIRKATGSHFDPEVVQAFETSEDEFRKVTMDNGDA